MAKTKTTPTHSKRAGAKRNAVTAKAASQELDSVFLLKLVIYLILGSQWVRIADESGVTILPVPLGLIVGLVFAAHDHFRIDRKIEYAVLLVAMLVGFWTQVGVYVRV